MAGVERIRCSLTSRIGTAGWSIPAAERTAFPPEGTHLERYATRFNAVEINSSFHRPHRLTTYQRWAASVGDDFRFSVKLPKIISHAPAGEQTKADIEQFANEVRGLGGKLGVTLVQFPPSRIFERNGVGPILEALASKMPCPLVCEPRHSSWFTPCADAFLANLRIARVAADPPPVKEAQVPGGWPGVRYHRLHGAPRVYYSAYDREELKRVHSRIMVEARDTDVWCIFDNTAAGAATSNALDLIAGP